MRFSNNSNSTNNVNSNITNYDYTLSPVGLQLDVGPAEGGVGQEVVHDLVPIPAHGVHARVHHQSGGAEQVVGVVAQQLVVVVLIWDEMEIELN